MDDAAQARAQQEADVHDFVGRRDEFAAKAHLSAYRVEVTDRGDLAVGTLPLDTAATPNSPPVRR